MRKRKGMENKALTVLLLGAFALVTAMAGCSSHRDITLTPVKAPRYVVPPQRVTAAAQTRNGSLWVDGSRIGQVSDFRARDINDLVTIRIVESTTAANSADLSTERDDTGKRGLTKLLGLEQRLPSSMIPTSLINAETDEEFESTGSNRRTETISSRMTARVIERLPNGNLVIQGNREVVINHERQTMVIIGIIRPVDIDDSNMILSTQIADLQIFFSGSGVLTENLRRGWLSRIVNYVWPF